MNYTTYEVRVYESGTRCWYVNGKLHREDWPAVEWADGDRHWYANGKRHREDGPAVESAGGSCWYLNGKRHREDGPAVEFANSRIEWWLNDKRYATESEWRSALNPGTCEGKIVEIEGRKYKLQEV